jgi:hypothetical protein
MKFKLGKEHNERDFIVCDFCTHILIRRYTCEAFPQGIPEEILNRKNNHSKTLPEQGNNIVFGLKNNLMMPLI